MTASEQHAGSSCDATDLPWAKAHQDEARTQKVGEQASGSPRTAATADDGATASRIVLTQVKYSPLHPERPWALGRLAQGSSDTRRRRRPAVGRSVVAKLAQAYTALRAELTMSQAGGDPVELVVQLHTNQHLDRQLQSQLLRIQRAVTLASPEDRPAILGQLSRSDADTFALLRKAAALDTQEFVEFLAGWNLTAFGQPMLAHEVGATFRLASRVMPRSIREVLRLLRGVRTVGLRQR